ncbi:glucuronate isomerase [Paracoccaceae bacterium]|nr:glucuronate isomerase [Paracoccaceae bacterium]
MPLLHKDRLLPQTEVTLSLAREFYQSIAKLPIISPHGHCDPVWFSKNKRFPDPAQLFVVPDHYVFRMLVSQGFTLSELGVNSIDGSNFEKDPKEVWKKFSENYYLFRGTPTAMWLDYSFNNVFGITEPLTPANSDFYYNEIEEKLSQPEYLPRALFDRFNIEVLSTTDAAISDLSYHTEMKNSNWNGRIIPTYRPDSVVDPESRDFKNNLSKLGELTNEDTNSWDGYLKAHRSRRLFFKEMGATASDHGHASARTENLSHKEAEQLYKRILAKEFTSEEADQFRGQMLTEMAKMSCEDGLVMQIHPGSRRNHSNKIFGKFGLDKGFDIPGRTDYVSALKPLLDEVGLRTDLTIILFTLDEASYSRELAPMAGVYPALKLGPPWWFFDSYEGMKRFRESTTETCGFYNTVGFNDDTRAFCSIPARHDVARRVDCSYLAELVSSGRLRENEAYEVAYDLAYGLAKSAYKL